MATLQEILARAQALREETALGSISPERAGSIMYDTLQQINQMQLEGGSLVISKIYESVAAMQADTAPVSDLTGQDLRQGQLVVIVPSDTSSSDLGSVYRYNGTTEGASSWSFTGKIGGYPMDQTPTQGSTRAVTSGGVYEQITQLDQDVDGLDETVNGRSETIEVLTEQSLTADKYYNVNSKTSMPNNPGTLSGCYCAKIPVVAGEKYRVSGYLDNNTASRLYATYASDGTRLRYCTTSSAVVRQSFDLTMQENEVFLIVNLKQYDASQGDGFWKVDTQTIQTDGLVEKVERIENNMPGVIDSLDSTSPTDALSANQGRILNEDINGVTTETAVDQEVIADKYLNTNNSRIPSRTNLASLAGVYVCYLNVQPGEKYRIYGNGLAPSSARQLYAMADANRYVVENGTPGVAINSRESGYDLTIPDGVAFLVVNLNAYDSATDKVQKIGSTTTDCVKTRLNALEQADIDLTRLALPLSGKKVMVFGDSIYDYTYNQKGVAVYLAEASGASVIKAAVGGTRFVQRTTPVDTPTSSAEAYAALDICNMVKAWCEADYTKQDAATTYLNDFTARVNALKDNPISGVDFVIIGGGTNDISAGSPIGTASDSDFSTIHGSINKMIQLLLTANPSLKIYFSSPVVGYHGDGGRTDANWDDNYQFSSGLTKPQYIEIFATATKRNHIPYIDVYSTLGINQTNFSNYYLDTDDHHPYKGFDVIARRIYGQMKSLME